MGTHAHTRYRLVSIWLVTIVCLSVVAPAVVAPVEAAGNSSTELSGCTTITTSGTYVLAGDVDAGATSPCIEVVADDVVIDGQGYTIEGSGGLFGVLVYDSGGRLSNVTVEDLTVTEFSYGVRFVDVDGGGIRQTSVSGERIQLAYSTGVAVEDATGGGLMLHGGGSHVVRNWAGEYVQLAQSTDNELVGNHVHGLSVEGGSHRNTLRDNVLVDVGGRGLTVDNANDNRLENNSVENGTGYGIKLRGAEGNVLLDNAVTGTKEGLVLDGSPGNVLRDNALSGNTYGLSVEISRSRRSWALRAENDVDTSNTVDGRPIYYLVGAADVVVDASTNAGFVAAVSSRNVTVRGLALGDNSHGVLLVNTTNATVEDVDVSGVSRAGVDVVYSNDTVVSNTSVVDSQGASGLRLDRSHRSTVEDVEVRRLTGSLGDGVTVRKANWNVLRRITVANTTLNDGISVDDSHNVTILDSVVADNREIASTGIDLDETNDTVVSGSSIENNSYDGMMITDSYRFVIRDNRILNNDVDGVYLEDSHDGVLCNNEIAGSGDLDVENYDGSSTYETSCPAPEVDTNRTTLDFGDVPYGDSATAAFDVTNAGSRGLAVSTTNVTGADAGDFTVSGGGSFVLDPGENRTLSVTFAPSSIGAHAASLGIESNDSDEATLPVGLAGFGAKPGGSTVSGETVVGCTNITSAGQYSLIAGVSDSTEAVCIRISASDVLLDGRGMTIDGVDGGYDTGTVGVLVAGSGTLTNVTVSNLTVTDWDYGIHSRDVRLSTIEGNTLAKNDDGVVLEGTSDSTVEDNRLAENWDAGIVLNGSARNDVVGNNATRNEIGVWLIDADANGLHGNVLRDSYGSGLATGLFLEDTADNAIYDNLLVNDRNVRFAGTNRNVWNVSPRAGTTVVGGPTLGGNYWGKPDGTGLSQVEADPDRDGFVNATKTLASGAVDHRPLKQYYPVIDAPGRYVLTRDVRDAARHVMIEIRSGDVVLDGRGHTVDGLGHFNYVDDGNALVPDDESVGIAIEDGSGLRNVTITNLTVAGWGSGISLEGPANVTIENVTATGNLHDGIRLDGVTNASIGRSTATGNRDVGVLLNATTNSSVTGTTAGPNSRDGIGLRYGSNDNVLRANDASGNGRYGIVLEKDSIGTILEDNVADGNGNPGHPSAGGGGLTLIYGADDNVVRNNTARGNADDGIKVATSHENRVANNTLAGNGRAGLYLRLANRNELVENVATGNHRHGVFLEQAETNTIANNTARANAESGVDLVASGQKWSGNTISDNVLRDNRDGLSIATSHGSVLTGNELVGNSRAGLALNRINYTAIYDNVFNNTQNVAFDGPADVVTWNAIVQAGPNVVGGPLVGGNVWAAPDGSGFSQQCGDADGDGFCDASYAVSADHDDHYPLVRGSSGSGGTDGSGGSDGVEGSGPTVGFQAVSGNHGASETVVYSNATVHAWATTGGSFPVTNVTFVLESTESGARHQLPATRTTGGADWTATFDVTDGVEDGRYRLLATAVSATGRTTTETADPIVVVDRQAPTLGIGVESSPDTAVRVTVWSDETILTRATTVEVTLPDGTVVDPGPLRGAGPGRYRAFVDVSGVSRVEGAYAASVRGPDPTGNVGAANSTATIETVTTQNDSATLEADSGTAVTINTSGNASGRVSVTETNTTDEGLPSGSTGAVFVSVELDGDLDAKQTGGVLQIPVRPVAGHDAADVTIHLFNETTRTWQPYPTTVETIGGQEYWVAHVPHFSTYGALAVDPGSSGAGSGGGSSGSGSDGDEVVSDSEDEASSRSGAEAVPTTTGGTVDGGTPVPEDDEPEASTTATVTSDRTTDDADPLLEPSGFSPVPLLMVVGVLVAAIFFVRWRSG